MTQIHFVQGDITTLAVDAIVNAANESMLGGGGVDGAIHHAAGPGLLEECRSLPGPVRCPTGEARITGGYKLPARHVIHTVGPVWHGGARNESGLLESSYRNCLDLAAQHRVKSIAFPFISAGVFGYPKAEAAKIAIGTVKAWKESHPGALNEVVFCLFSHADGMLFQDRWLESFPVLVVPGWSNSGTGHWQSLWQERFPSWRRVLMPDWFLPARSGWLDALDASVASFSEPPVLLAHSLGCATVAHWLTGTQRKVRGAFLVAPADADADDLPDELKGFSGLPMKRFPCPSLLVASGNDRWMRPERAQQLADAWGCRFHMAGDLGHINVDSGHGPWSEGRGLLSDFLAYF